MAITDRRYVERRILTGPMAPQNDKEKRISPQGRNDGDSHGGGGRLVMTADRRENMSLWSEVGWTMLAAFGPVVAAAGIFGAFRFWQVFLKK